MSVKKKSEAGSNKAAYQHGQDKTATSTGSIPDVFCCDKSGAQNVQVNIIGDYSNILSVIEQLIGEGIRNFFSDPKCQHILADCLAYNNIKKPPDSNPLRNISNNEILRPRDLPQVTGLGKTSIWRLEKAGHFVKKLKLSNGCVGYLRSDVEAWVSSKQIIEKGES